MMLIGSCYHQHFHIFPRNSLTLLCIFLISSRMGKSIYSKILYYCWSSIIFIYVRSQWCRFNIYWLLKWYLLMLYWPVIKSSFMLTPLFLHWYKSIMTAIAFHFVLNLSLNNHSIVFKNSFTKWVCTQEE